MKVVNAACPGETSSSLIDNTAQSNGCENTPGKGNVGYRTLYPLHVSYSGSQLAFAVSYLKKHQNVRLVSLMIGANDGLMCQETTADQCTSLPEQAAVLETVAKNVHTILSEIRTKAHYNGQLAIVNYYSVDAAVSYRQRAVRAAEPGRRRRGQAVPRRGRGRVRRVRDGGRTLERRQHLHRRPAHAARGRVDPVRHPSELRRGLAPGAGAGEGDPLPVTVLREASRLTNK